MDGRLQIISQISALEKLISSRYDHGKFRSLYPGINPNLALEHARQALHAIESDVIARLKRVSNCMAYPRNGFEQLRKADQLALQEAIARYPSLSDFLDREWSEWGDDYLDWKVYAGLAPYPVPFSPPTFSKIRAETGGIEKRS